MRIISLLLAAGLALCAPQGFSKAAAPATSPYKVIKNVKVDGKGRLDFVFADAAGRRLYVPRNAGADSRVSVFNLDTLAPVGNVPSTPVRGADVDPKSGHGFCSSKPVVMWDTKTLKTIKTIDVQGNPDVIMFEPLTERIYVLSHAAPNATVLDAKDGSVVGTIDLGGAPEQAVSDGKGHVYIDLEDKNSVAVVDANTLKVTANYSLEGKGSAPAGLGFDPKNRVLFACCAEPATAVILNADDGKVITALPIGAGCDGAVFNPATMELFSSQRDGTLTVIKETSPTAFEVAQTVKTMPGAKTLTLDSKTNQVYLIAPEMAPRPAQPVAPSQPDAKTGKGGRKGGRNQFVPKSFTIIVVGK